MNETSHKNTASRFWRALFWRALCNYMGFESTIFALPFSFELQAKVASGSWQFECKTSYVKQLAK